MAAILSATSALLTWQDASPDIVRESSYRYKIQTWVGNNENDIKETVLKGTFTKALVNTLTPDSINFARIAAVENKYNGPYSNVIEIETPEGVPGPVQSLNVFPLGSSSFMLRWKRMNFTNGILQGYKISCEEVLRKPRGDELQPKYEHEPYILNTNATQAKLPWLKSNTIYRVHIVGFTEQGNGEE